MYTLQSGQGELNPLFIFVLRFFSSHFSKIPKLYTTNSIKMRVAKHFMKKKRRKNNLTITSQGLSQVT